VWISLIGAEGTCKRTVAELLHSQENFRIVGDSYTPKSSLTSDCYYHQIDFLTSRYDTQYLEIQPEINNEDVVQIRTFWDTHEIYSKVLLKHELITKSDYESLSKIYKSLNRSLIPPATVFYCKTTLIDSLDRMKLKSEEPHHEEYLCSVREACDEYVSNIRVPVVEIDVSRPFNEVSRQVLFGLNSVKSTKVGGQSMWKKTMMRI
jgi:thymidylate kinase